MSFESIWGSEHIGDNKELLYFHSVALKYFLILQIQAKAMYKF